MKTNRFELKDWRLNTYLDMISTSSKALPNFTAELNRQWVPGKAMTIKFCGRFSVDLKPEDVRENHEFKPNEWNPTKSWNIPKNVELMFSIQENKSGQVIALLRGYFDGEYFRRPNGGFMSSFCRGFHSTKFKSMIKCWPEDEDGEIISGRFLELLAEYDRRIEEIEEEEDEE